MNKKKSYRKGGTTRKKKPVKAASKKKKPRVSMARVLEVDRRASTIKRQSKSFQSAVARKKSKAKKKKR